MWRGEFVELGKFLKRGLSALIEETSFSLVQAGASLQVRQASRAPRIANIEQWTTAFLASSIFVEKLSGRARELFKYIDTVRAIVRFGGYNWRAYDVQFRLRQARQPHRSWAAIDTELWLTVATAQPRGGFHAGGRPQALPFRGGRGLEFPPQSNEACTRGLLLHQREEEGPARASTEREPITASHSMQAPASEERAALRTCARIVAPPPTRRWPVPGGQKGITAIPGKELGPTPIRLDRMLQFLRNYGDRDAATRIADGFSFGFRLGFKGDRVAVEARNLISAKQHARELMAKLLKEIKLGRIVGPFTTPPISNFRCSPVGVVPKKTPGDFRMIQHLSAPRGASVNDHIDPQECGVNYSTFDDAVDLITRLGQGAFMGKADIQLFGFYRCILMILSYWACASTVFTIMIVASRWDVRPRAQYLSGLVLFWNIVVGRSQIPSAFCTIWTISSSRPAHKVHVLS